jgi:triosephosphate isomerase (TIM)
MRKKIVAGNWKMNTSLQEGIALAMEINKLVKTGQKLESTGVIIAPPFTHLSEINKVIDTEKICLAAQNCSWEEKGAYTGEISVGMLKSLGCKAVIIGHSERRSYFKEDNQILCKKVKLVLQNDMKPVYCCGELLDERESNRQFEVVKQQIVEGLFSFSKEEFLKIRIAYEPVWAIGTGKTATPAQAQEMHAYIRSLIKEKYGNEVAENTTILYGGSCNAANAKELFSNPDVDGGLIGGASLKASDFMTIINSF